MNEPQSEDTAHANFASKIDAVHVTAVSALLYVIGFVVSNAYFGQYELLRPELLRARYLAAAVLFVFCAAIPVGIGLAAGRLERIKLAQENAPNQTPSKSLGTRLVEGGWVPILVVTLLVGAGHVGILYIISVNTPRLWLADVSFFLYVAVNTWFIGEHPWRDDAASKRYPWWAIGRMTMGATLVLVSAVALPAMFAVFIYGSVRPEYGGGAVRVGELISTTGVVARTSPADDSLVAVLDLDEHIINVVACRRSPGGKATRVPIALRADSIHAVQSSELIVLNRRSGLHTWCIDQAPHKDPRKVDSTRFKNAPRPAPSSQ